MNHSPTATRVVARLRLFKLCLGLVILAAVTSHSLSLASTPAKDRGDGAKTVTLPLKVCVLNDARKHVAVQPLLLNSTINASDVIQQETSDGCYKSNPLKLKVGQIYFAAAMFEGSVALSQFTVSPGDKEKSVDLTLVKSGSQGNADIEICASDASGHPLPITNVAALDNLTQLKEQTPNDSNCYRVSAAASNKYQLSLTTQSARGILPNTALGLFGAEIILTLGALALIVFFVMKFRRLLPPLTAQEATVTKINQAVQGLSVDMRVIKQKVDELIPLVPPRTQESASDQLDAVGVNETHLPASNTDASRPAESEQPSPATAVRPSSNSQPQLNFDDAKSKYQDLSLGRTVEHFYLMPSGASAASSMVEDAGVELHEQSNGTYVGFRSSVNEHEAMIFPMPNVHFNSETFKALFPELTKPEYESGKIKPRLAVNTQPKVWMVQREVL